MATPLDNPVFASLETLHRAFARGRGTVKRYLADVAPFIGLPGDEARGADLEALIAPGEEVLFVGPRVALPAPWKLEDHGVILQMVCERAGGVPKGPPIVSLNETYRAPVLELTALVYPHYFRPRTMELGRYFGIIENGRLAAMAGERMGMPGFRELSAICTHPDFLGRGLARRLLVFLSHDIATRGDTPFLHVSPKNERAIRLYEQNGFRTRAEMPFAALRAPSP